MLPRVRQLLLASTCVLVLVSGSKADVVPEGFRDVPVTYRVDNVAAFPGFQFAAEYVYRLSGDSEVELLGDDGEIGPPGYMGFVTLVAARRADGEVQRVYELARNDEDGGTARSRLYRAEYPFADANHLVDERSRVVEHRVTLHIVSVEDGRIEMTSTIHDVAPPMLDPPLEDGAIASRWMRGLERLLVLAVFAAGLVLWRRRAKT